MHHLWHHIASLLGLTDINGPNYAFWSGVGSDLGEFAIAGAILRGVVHIKRHHRQVHNQITQEFANLKREAD